MEPPNLEEAVTHPGTLIAIAAALIVTAIKLGSIYGELGMLGLSVVTTSILTLALVILYFQQYKVLDRQVEWMKRRYEATLERSPEVVAEEDKVFLDLRNVGRGAVHAIELRAEIVDEIESLNLEPGYVRLQTVEGDDSGLPPFSDRKKFEAEPKIGLSKDDKLIPLPIKSVTRKLANHGLKKCTLRLTLEVYDESLKEGGPWEMAAGEQQLDLPEVKEVEIPAGDGESRTVSTADQTTLEESLPGRYPQDIVPKYILDLD